MRTTWKGILGAGMLGGIAYGAWRAWNARLPDRAKTLDWSAAPFPFPPVPRPVAVPAPSPVPSAAEPHDDGSCPASYPIKAKLTSGIYHAPGGLNYERTKADRCYVDGGAAEADGLRASKV
jgi:hypothetical protein